VEANPWWAVKLPGPRPIAAVSLLAQADCGCTADLQGSRILVGQQPWTGPASAANFTLCAAVPGVLRGQRRTFACGATPGGGPPVGRYIAVWRPGDAKRALTLCEVDVVYGPGTTARSLPRTRRLQRIAGAEGHHHS
jgi:hypothetical protein